MFSLQAEEYKEKCSSGERRSAYPFLCWCVILLIAGAFCCIGDTDEQARAKFPTALLSCPVAAGALIGGPETIRQHLAELEEVGVQELILGFADILQQDTLRFFAQEFIG
jgi:alkanesulfonate monooxygenase SsuD/methylene tetrahydromethanopterin reductase-like flavin-dependent oxidoreductase (luciferase family)